MSERAAALVAAAQRRRAWEAEGRARYVLGLTGVELAALKALVGHALELEEATDSADAAGWRALHAVAQPALDRAALTAWGRELLEEARTENP
jgi:hypothetical protein